MAIVVFAILHIVHVHTPFLVTLEISKMVSRCSGYCHQVHVSKQANKQIKTSFWGEEEDEKE